MYCFLTLLVKKLLAIDPTAEKVQILRKKIPKIQFLFNFQNFDTKMFAKPLATDKKYFKKLSGQWPVQKGKKRLKNAILEIFKSLIKSKRFDLQGNEMACTSII